MRPRYARFADFLSSAAFTSTLITIGGMAAKCRMHLLVKFAGTDVHRQVIADSIAVILTRPITPACRSSASAFVALPSRSTFFLRHFRGASIPRRSGTGEFLARFFLAHWRWPLAGSGMRLGSDVPSRYAQATFQAWDKAVPNNRTCSTAVARPGRSRQSLPTRSVGWDASISMWRDGGPMALARGKDPSFASCAADLPVNRSGREGIRLPTIAGRLSPCPGACGQCAFLNLVSKVYAETRHESLNETQPCDAVMNEFSAVRTAC